MFASGFASKTAIAENPLLKSKEVAGPEFSEFVFANPRDIDWKSRLSPPIRKTTVF
jgi:hypothetical protein